MPRDSSIHRDYIYIVPDDGCYSLVGRTGGRQPVSLDAGCIQTGELGLLASAKRQNKNIPGIRIEDLLSVPRPYKRVS